MTHLRRATGSARLVTEKAEAEAREAREARLAGHRQARAGYVKAWEDTVKPKAETEV